MIEQSVDPQLFQRVWEIKIRYCLSLSGKSMFAFFLLAFFRAAHTHTHRQRDTQVEKGTRTHTCSATWKAVSLKWSTSTPKSYTFVVRCKWCQQWRCGKWSTVQCAIAAFVSIISIGAMVTRIPCTLTGTWYLPCTALSLSKRLLHVRPLCTRWTL